jgi:hypothetical protein
MTRPLPRTNLHSSQLIRCLADLAVVNAAEPDNAFAEKLSQWIHFTDAIKLSAVHNDGIVNLPTVETPARGTNQAATRAQAGSEFDRVSAALTISIRRSCTTDPVKSHIPLPPALPVLPQDLAAAYVPYRRFYDAHQRDMELGIQPLRVNVREALAKTSPRLKQLADLDTVLETILRERERKLLAKVPLLLKKRFEELLVTRPGAWPTQFHNDLQTLLLAELDLRLQPTLGLIEALNNH